MTTNKLEPTDCKDQVLQHIYVDINDDRIELCHRINKNSNRTALKFPRCKDSKNVNIMALKSELKILILHDIDLPEGATFFINESLYPYYRGLCNECKKASKKRKIYSFYTVTGTVRIKVQQQGPFKTITHIDELRDDLRLFHFSSLLKQL